MTSSGLREKPSIKHFGVLLAERGRMVSARPMQLSGGSTRSKRGDLKLVRTFTAPGDALTRRRSGGSPSVSVGHVSISAVGQAIIGNLTQSQREAVPGLGCPFTAAPRRRKGGPNVNS